MIPGAPPQVHDQVLVAGDWHGSRNAAGKAIKAAAARGIKAILHVGDFGIYNDHDGVRYLRDVQFTCDRYDVDMIVTPGNHEDWDLIDNHGLADLGKGWGKVAWVRSRIAVLPRGHRFEISSTTGTVRSFVSLGGAPSIDRWDLTEGVDWFPTEVMTEDDVERTIVGGPADVMITHDAPSGGTDAVEAMFVTNPLGLSTMEKLYAEEGKRLVTRAWHGVAPQLLFHGHMHLADRKRVPVGPYDVDAECEVIALDMNGRPGNLVVLDIETLTVTEVDPAAPQA